nr:MULTISPECIES: hypothetical protein [Bradyrhizobium]
MRSYKGSYSSSERLAEWEPPSRDNGECAGTGPERPGDAESAVGLGHDSIHIFNAANTLMPDRRADVRLGDALAAHRILKKLRAMEQQFRLRIGHDPQFAPMRYRKAPLRIAARSGWRSLPKTTPR